MGRGLYSHGGRSVDPNNSMTKADQVAADPTLSTADVESESTGGRNEREESVAVKAPVTVVARCSGPRDPISCISVPGVTHHLSIVPSVHAADGELDGPASRRPSQKWELW